MLTSNLLNVSTPFNLSFDTGTKIYYYAKYGANGKRLEILVEHDQAPI